MRILHSQTRHKSGAHGLTQSEPQSSEQHGWGCTGRGCSCYNLEPWVTWPRIKPSQQAFIEHLLEVLSMVKTLLSKADPSPRGGQQSGSWQGEEIPGDSRTCFRVRMSMAKWTLDLLIFKVAQLPITCTISKTQHGLLMWILKIFLLAILFLI